MVKPGHWRERCKDLERRIQQLQGEPTAADSTDGYALVDHATYARLVKVDRLLREMLAGGIGTHVTRWTPQIDSLVQMYEQPEG